MKHFFFEKWEEILNGSKLMQWFFLSGLTICIISMGCIFWIYPSWNKYLLIEKDLKTLKATLLSQKERSKNYEQLKRSTRTLEDDLRSLTNHWVKPEIEAEGIQSLLNMAKKTGLRLQSFVQEKYISRSFYTIIPIKTNLIGNYQQLLCFLNETAALSKGISFESMHLTRTKSNDALEEQSDLLQIEILWVIPQLNDMQDVKPKS